MTPRVVRRRSRLARTRFEGIHCGDFLGFAPTGKPVEWLGAALFSLNDSKIGDSWVLGDTQGLRDRLSRDAKH